MERKPHKMLLGWCCFQVITRAHHRFVCTTRLGLWLLGWAGYYAHAPERP